VAKAIITKHLEHTRRQRKSQKYVNFDRYDNCNISSQITQIDNTTSPQRKITRNILQNVQNSAQFHSTQTQEYAQMISLSIEVSSDRVLASNFLLKLHDSVHQSLSSGRTAWNVNINRNNAITSSNDRV